MDIAASETVGWGIKPFRWWRFTGQTMPMTQDGGCDVDRLLSSCTVHSSSVFWVGKAVQRWGVGVELVTLAELLKWLCDLTFVRAKEEVLLQGLQSSTKKAVPKLRD